MTCAWPQNGCLFMLTLIAAQTVAAKFTTIPVLKTFTPEQMDNFMDDMERYVMAQCYLKYVVMVNSIICHIVAWCAHMGVCVDIYKLSCLLFQSPPSLLSLS